MSPWLLALIGAGQELVTQTFTSNGSFTVPLGVSKVNLSGKGQDGAASYSGTQLAYAAGDTVTGHFNGTGTVSGAYSWSDFQDLASRVAQVNGGGNGNFYYNIYDGYLNTNTYTLSSAQTTYNDAVPGTASMWTSPGWHVSGAVLGNDYGYSAVQYTQTYTVPATTGANTTGFGKTFPGGAGGPASVTSFTDVAVTENTSYPVTVPTGGSLTISYYR